VRSTRRPTICGATVVNRSLSVARHDVPTQMLVHATNALLGNIGRTIDVDHPSLQKQGDDGAVMRLIEDMSRGNLDVLIVYGVNPRTTTHTPIDSSPRWRECPSRCRSPIDSTKRPRARTPCVRIITSSKRGATQSP